MRKICAILAVFVSMFFEATSQNMLLEDFIFPPTDSLENLGGWNRTGLNYQYNIKVVSPGLTYANYAGSGLGNSCQIANSGNGDILFKNLSSPITSGAAYLSFMIRIDNLPATMTEGYCIAFNPNTGGTNLNTRLHIKRLSNTTFDFAIQKTGGAAKTYANMIFDKGKTYLVVLKYSIVTGTDNDAAGVYVFENGVPATEPNTPTVTTTAGSDFTGQGAVYLNNNYAQDGLNGCDIKIDGIRAGTSWATSVLSAPTSAVHENADEIRPQSFPNPFREETTLQFRIPQKGFVSVNIYNAAGAHCVELFNGNLEGGEHKIQWNAAGFPVGMYTCKIQYNGAAAGRQLLRIE